MANIPVFHGYESWVYLTTKSSKNLRNPKRREEVIVPTEPGRRWSRWPTNGLKDASVRSGDDRTWEHPPWIPWRDMDLYLYLNHQVPPTEIWQKYPTKIPKKTDGFWKNASPVRWNFGSRKVCSMNPSLVWLPEGNTYGRKTPEKFTSASPENHLKMNKTHHFFRVLGSKAFNFAGCFSQKDSSGWKISVSSP